MAGGSGTRLWPLSRKARPKQLLRLFNGRSLIQHARLRLEGLFKPENIWVITSQAYLDAVAEELPDIPRDNLIGEPMGRDTANAIGLAAHLLARREPNATMAVFTADHLISPYEPFAAALRSGLEAAEAHDEALVTFGITPSEPHTGYGYIHRGESIAANTYRVLGFKEKPLREVAEQYLKSGEYFWNSGMFVWKISTILASLAAHLPENDRTLAALAADWENLVGSEELATRFGALERISIDYGVMEKADVVLTVEMNCDWLDLGSWTSLAATLTPDTANNVAAAPNALVVDGMRNIVVSESEHLIVTLGVDDLVVVHSDDATLVCRRDKVEQVKDLVNLRVKKCGDRFE